MWWKFQTPQYNPPHLDGHERRCDEVPLVRGSYLPPPARRFPQGPPLRMGRPVAEAARPLARRRNAAFVPADVSVRRRSGLRWCARERTPPDGWRDDAFAEPDGR